jgi:hypothetical protein
MIRIVIEHGFIFLVPTILYVAWIAFSRDDWPGLDRVVTAAPLLNLFAAGAALVLAVLFGFSSRTGNTPDESYVPPHVQDGKLEPGHPVPASK